MKRRLHHSLSSNSISSTSLSSPILDDIEPLPKRQRILQSPTLSSSSSDETENQDEDIIIDEPAISSVSITELSDSEDDDDIIEDEVEFEDDISFIDVYSSEDAIILVSDSDSDDDQGIDVTDDIPISISSFINESTISSRIEDIDNFPENIEIESPIMDDETNIETINDEIVTNDNTNSSNELIDLTIDETFSPSRSETDLSTDVQQCPICLEDLSHLQHSGIYLTITQCRHVMCTLCSRQLLAISPRCPLCRENVSFQTLTPYCLLT